MKVIVRGSVLVVAVAMVLACAAAGEGKDISGRWVAPFNREGTPVTIVMNLKVSGGEVTGTITHARGMEMKIENGKLEGDQLNFECNIEGPGGRKFNFHYSGDVVEDSIKLRGAVNGQEGGQTLNFHRSDKVGEEKDLSGRWVAPFNREGTPDTVVMNLKASGADLTGTITLRRGMDMKIENGKLEGEKLSFDASADGPEGRKFNFHFIGELTGDSIKLHNEVNGQPGNQTLNFHRGDK